MKFMKKIDWKRPKYILPVILLAAGAYIAYNAAGFFEESPEADDGLEKKEEFNTSLPEVNTGQVTIRSKMEEMQRNLELGKGYSGMENVEREEEEKMLAYDVYDEEEKRRMDSIDEVRMREVQNLERQLQEQRASIARGQDSPAQDDVSAIIASNPQIENYTRQLQLVQKIQRGEKIMTPEEEEQQRQADYERQVRQSVLDSIARTDGPASVVRAEDAGERAFNTVRQDKVTTELIRARVDEVVKAKDGSRIRIRLAEDVDIDGVRVRSGTCLYANVAGFSAQRVKAEITSVVLEGRLREVNLSVYDIDGQEGFFVPSSAFRDLAKEAGANAMQMNMNVNSSSGQSVEGMALQTLQQTLQSLTSAASSNIRKNRAKIKYNTDIYLVDTNSKK